MKKIKDLETKNLELSTKCDSKHKAILKFTQGQENLDRLLAFKELLLIKEESDITTLTGRKNTRISS